ncbi:MAG: hypothetical protein K2K45_07090 [Muribaculaceae bacterium]|nr:hypothetical protein [Paramuribaculum sp.]MDE6649677.1 hypothetical protein [Muribaculaceae bacterium]
MFKEVIWSNIKMLRFSILPGILGGIACFIGAPHSVHVKILLGIVIGYAIQHKHFKLALEANKKLLDSWLEE